MTVSKEELLQKYPDHATQINAVFASIDSDKCQGCAKEGRILKLRKELGDLTEDEKQQYISRTGGIVIGSPRPGCENCFKENISMAIVHLNRAVTGTDPAKFRWLAIAFLSEAASEIFGVNKDTAREIRDIKQQMIKDMGFVPDLIKYL